MTNYPNADWYLSDTDQAITNYADYLGYVLLGWVLSPSSILPTPSLDHSTSLGGQTHSPSYPSSSLALLQAALRHQGWGVIEGILKKSFAGGTPFQSLNNQPKWPFFQNNWQSNNQKRSHPQNYNSTNAPPSMNNVPVPMDISRGCAPNNWRGQGNSNWRQGRGPPTIGNVSAPG